MNELEQLKAQNAVLREALAKCYRVLSGDALGKRPLEEALRATQKALSLTPSDAAEIARKKDELIATLSYCLHKLVQYAQEERLDCFLINVVVPDVFINKCTKAIEAARAAGVEVDHD